VPLCLTSACLPGRMDAGGQPHDLGGPCPHNWRLGGTRSLSVLLPLQLLPPAALPTYSARRSNGRQRIRTSTWEARHDGKRFQPNEDGRGHVASPPLNADEFHARTPHDSRLKLQRQRHRFPECSSFTSKQLKLFSHHGPCPLLLTNFADE
jgi:hypothetical protein